MMNTVMEKKRMVESKYGTELAESVCQYMNMILIHKAIFLLVLDIVQEILRINTV